MRFRIHLLAASVVMIAAIWLSSGTMYPYASTWAFPIVSEPCGYLFNLDHPQYRAAFAMLDGAPRDQWEWSITLRRILYPLVAFPLMKVAGFIVGGFVASVAINVAALIALGFFVRRRWGDRGAAVAIWLLATYPGVTYWGALPYANATIVPVSLGLFMLLSRLDERPELRSVALNSAGMAILVTAYDLLPYFGVAAMILLARKRRWSAMPVAAVLIASGPLLVWVVFTKIVQLRWSNINTDIYGTMIDGYLHPGSVAAWLRSLASFPAVLVKVFLYSNMVFLPALFLVALIIARARLTAVEGALFGAVALVFCFNNLGPPLPATGQMRGEYIPRIYQPLCAALIVYCARLAGSLQALEAAKARLLTGAFALALLANLSVAFGPIARVPWAGNVYQRFYFHAFIESMDINLATHGRRPLGVCRHDRT